MNTFGTKVIDKTGTTVLTSKNLRGMRDYARVSPVVAVHCRKRKAHDKDPAGLLTVHYKDGCTSSAVFNSHAIMIDFVRNRRSWRSAVHVYHDGDMGYLTRPGIIAGATK